MRFNVRPQSAEIMGDTLLGTAIPSEVLICTAHWQAARTGQCFSFRDVPASAPAVLVSALSNCRIEVYTLISFMQIQDWLQNLMLEAKDNVITFEVG